ncbi:MAG: transposase [Gammaproteobacteria bacterium]|nr:transposase [Gammaproteobacteria bacterium]
MAQSRKSLISLQDTPYYHCISRCVRRSYLCGYDHTTNVSYEHRKSWVENRLLFLSSIFAIDICAYAVMSNHIHIVLCVNKSAALSWSLDTVLRQWHKIHRGTLLTQRYLKGEVLSDIEIKAVKETADIYRKRLFDISWFMRDLNEHIARKANEEDECTGRFWEGRFRSQALLTEKALLSCMAYVDLNPIRAYAAKSLNDSVYTSIYTRLFCPSKNKKTQGLIPFKDEKRLKNKKYLNLTLKQYCFLLSDSIAALNNSLPKNSTTSSEVQNVERVTIDTTSPEWLQTISSFENLFSFAVGNTASMLAFKKRTNRKRMACIKSAAVCFDD